MISRASWCARGSKQPWGRAFLVITGPRACHSGECMSDIIFLCGSVVFFAVAVLYVYGCRRLMKGGGDHA